MKNVAKMTFGEMGLLDSRQGGLDGGLEGGLRSAQSNNSSDQKSLASSTYKDGMLVPQSGQWYHLLEPDYWIMYENGKSYFMDSANFPQVRYILAKYQAGPMRAFDQKTFLTLGRVMDIVHCQPSIDDLGKAGYKMLPLTTEELNAFGNPDIENAIPVFTKAKRYE